MWHWVCRGCMVYIYLSLHHVFKQVGSPITDAQMIRKRRTSHDLLLVCSCMYTLQSGAFWVFPSSQKNLGYQVISYTQHRHCSIRNAQWLLYYFIIMIVITKAHQGQKGWCAAYNYTIMYSCKYWFKMSSDLHCTILIQGDHSTLVLFLGKRRICNNQLMCGCVKIFDYDLILLKVEG